MLTLAISGLLIYGIFYLYGDFVWPVLTVIVIGIICYLVFYK